MAENNAEEDIPLQDGQSPGDVEPSLWDREWVRHFILWKYSAATRRTILANRSNIIAHKYGDWSITIKGTSQAKMHATVFRGIHVQRAFFFTAAELNLVEGTIVPSKFFKPADQR